MKPSRAKLRALLLAFFLAGFPACDWAQFNFVNSIPLRGDTAKNPVVNVYLGVDGLSYHAAMAARERGAFSSQGTTISKFVSIFPATSDAAWTRIMHTAKIPSYEMAYYDPDADKLKHGGLLGPARHILPTFAEPISFEDEYLKVFDYRANGYTHSLEAYRDTYVSFADSLDQLFFSLDGRAETQSTFSGYLLEIDVLGHMQSFESTVDLLVILSKRIEAFKKQHPERKFNFTILSDHGIDFIRVQNDRLVKFGDAMERVGVQKVAHLKDHDPKREIFALPVEHVRVTYLALHTAKELSEEVGSRVSQLDSVDLAVSERLKAPDGSAAGMKWYALWSGGKLAGTYGFDPARDEYWLPSDFDFARFRMEPIAEERFTDGFVRVGDDEMFQRAKTSVYPDFFYRVRTGLANTGVDTPAEVLVSFRPTWASLGFKMPMGGNEIASAGFHGSLEELGSLGTLITDEREVPDTVRSDTFLELFPKMREHIEHRGVKLIEGDPNGSLNYNFKLQ